MANVSNAHATRQTAWNAAIAPDPGRFADGRAVADAYVSGQLSGAETAKYLTALQASDPDAAKQVANDFLTGVWDADNAAGRVGDDRFMRTLSEPIPGAEWDASLLDFARETAGWPADLQGEGIRRMNAEQLIEGLESGDRHQDPASWNGFQHQALLDQYPSRAGVVPDGMASTEENLVRTDLAKTAPPAETPQDPPSEAVNRALAEIDAAGDEGTRRAAVNAGADRLTLNDDDHQMVKDSVSFLEGLEERGASGDLSKQSISNLDYALNKSRFGLTSDPALKRDTGLKARAEKVATRLGEIGDQRRAEEETARDARWKAEQAELESPAAEPRPTTTAFDQASEAITEGHFERVNKTPYSLEGYSFLHDPSGERDFSNVPATIQASRGDPEAQKIWSGDGTVRYEKSNPERDRFRWTVDGQPTSDSLDVIAPDGTRHTFSNGTAEYEHLRRELHDAIQEQPLDPVIMY